MINQNAIDAVNASRLNAHFTKPLYDSYCFANIPALIRHALTGEGQLGFPDDVLGSLPRRYKKVVLLFIDAFGWRFFSPWLDRSPFLKRFADRGVVSKITSQFPSTTTAHITALHTGLPVGQSGAFEWYYYEPLVDRMIAPMLFSFAGDHERETLLKTGIAPEAFYPPQSLYHDLAAHGVKSTLIQYHDYANSTYLRSVLSGTTSLAYKSLPEGLSLLSDAVNAADGPSYFFLGIDMIDSLCHHYGPHSPRLEAEIDTTLYALEKHFYQNIADSEDTLLLVTADHGQTDVSPDTMIDLRETTPSLEGMMRRNRVGNLLVPGGSSRDVFLYIEPDHLAEAQSLLGETLAGRAEVYRIDDLIDQGFFGTVGDRFRAHVGNLVVLPYVGQSVWWTRNHPRFYGHHGGLTPDEMETILLAVDR